MISMAMHNIIHIYRYMSPYGSHIDNTLVKRAAARVFDLNFELLRYLAWRCVHIFIAILKPILQFYLLNGRDRCDRNFYIMNSSQKSEPIAWERVIIHDKYVRINLSNTIKNMRFTMPTLKLMFITLIYGIVLNARHIVNEQFGCRSFLKIFTSE